VVRILPRLLRWLLFAGWLIVASGLLLLAVEGVARFAGYGPADRVKEAERFERRGYGKFVPDPELIWVLRRSWEGREPRGAAVRTNRLGLRGAEPTDRDGLRGRIAFLGDSVTYGHNLEEKDTIPARLAADLSRRLSGPVEVVNAGVPGYSTFQQGVQLTRLGEELAPDLVLLGFCLNDVTERYTWLSGYGGARFFMGGVDTTAAMGPLQRLWALSALRDWITTRLRDRAQQEERYEVSRLWLEPDAPEVRDAWSRVFEELRDLARRSRELDAPLAVVIYPFMEQMGAPRERAAPQAELVAFLRQEGIPALDLLAVPAIARRGPRIFQDPSHFAATGARAAARGIAEWIAAAHLLGPGASTP
jgi:lysophospholipase L1-like esterase